MASAAPPAAALDEEAHALLLSRVARGLKTYLEAGRREDGWLPPSASQRPPGHCFDVAAGDSLGASMGDGSGDTSGSDVSALASSVSTC